MKKIISITLLFLFLIALSINSLAHPVSQNSTLDTYNIRAADYLDRYANGGEDIGWGTKTTEGHAGGTTTTYRFNDNITDAHKNMFRTAVSRWENSTYASMTESSSAIGLVAYATFTGDPWVVAVADTTDYNSSYHTNSWLILINVEYMSSVTATTLAHEIGHVFGLVDLYEGGASDPYNRDDDVNNKGKLMYYSESRTATGPTSSEIRGFNFVTGVHSSHTWKYENNRKTCIDCHGYKSHTRNYSWGYANAASHKGTCSITGEVVYEPHRFYASQETNWYCSRCGYQLPSSELNSTPDVPLIE